MGGRSSQGHSLLQLTDLHRHVMLRMIATIPDPWRIAHIASMDPLTGWELRFGDVLQPDVAIATVGLLAVITKRDPLTH